MVMTKNKDKLLEKLAELEHIQWAHWTKYMLNKINEGDTKSVKRWKKQITTPYFKLSEAEKESDRMWARKVLKSLGKKPQRVILSKTRKHF